MQLWQYCLLVTARSLYMLRTLSASIVGSTIVMEAGFVSYRFHHCSGNGGSDPTEATIVVKIVGRDHTDATICSASWG